MKRLLTLLAALTFACAGACEPRFSDPPNTAVSVVSEPKPVEPPSTAVYAAPSPGGVPYITQTQLIEIRPGDKVDLLGDSLTARGWYYPLVNYAATIYATPPTWVMRAQSGSSLLVLRSAQVPNVIADQPNVLFIENENEYPTNNTATTQARLEAVIDDVKAGVPSIRAIGVLLPFAGGSEKWNPVDAAADAKLQKVRTAYLAACLSRGVVCIDTHNTNLVAQSRYNPTNAASGIVTLDNIHPSEAGNDLMSATVNGKIYWRGAGPEQSQTWTPAQLATPPTLWLRARDLVLADGDAVSNWTGVGPTFTASGTARPTYKASVAAFGNTPAVRFDGIDDVMQSTFSISGAKTIVIVYKLASLPASNQFVSLLTIKATSTLVEFVPAYNSVVVPRMMFLDEVPSGTINPPGTSAVYSTGLWRLFHIYNGGPRTSTSSYAHFDSFSLAVPIQASSTGFSQPQTATSLGARLVSGVGSNFTPVDVSEVIVFPGAMNAADQAQVGWYLRRVGPNPIPYVP